ncbi:MAG: butyrate kinase [Bacillota bacterium]
MRINGINILAINPGSTSTRVALFCGEECVFSETVAHPREVLLKCSDLLEQLPLRTLAIERVLSEHDVSLGSLSCIMARGGMLPPCAPGAYRVGTDMLDYVRKNAKHAHISGVACLIAHELAERAGIPAYIYDPVTVDELSDLARITGLKELNKECRGHALSVRACAREMAEKLGRDWSKCTFIVAHLGGGCTVWLVQNAKCVDMYSDDDGCFSPERAGRLQAVPLIRMCFEGGYTLDQMIAKIRREGGLISHLGTSDAREVEERISAGDERARLVYEALAYGVGKCIGDLAAAAKGKVDRIILTGGLSNSKMLTGWIRERTEWIAPVELMSEEREMRALAMGGLRVLRGEEQAKEFYG